MTIGCGFSPDPSRARLIDARMHIELGASLSHILEACEGILETDCFGVDKLIAALSSGGTFGPRVFSRYYDLVEAIDRDDIETAARLLGELGQAVPAKASIDITVLDNSVLADGAAYLRTMNDGETDLQLVPALPQSASAFRKRLVEALGFLDRTMPTLAGELRAIVRQVILCGSDTTKALQFDGGSSQRLWGALFLNTSFHSDEVAVVEVLAHESAHSLLFGFCIDEPLVRNDPEARYPSPLRVDDRPMDGIYHATYVSARMHLAMSQIAANAGLPEAWRDRARASAIVDLNNFAAGHATVFAHGELTTTGSALMASAKEYMDAVA